MFSLPGSEFTPDTGQVPAILVVMSQTAQMQQNSVESSQIKDSSGAILLRAKFVRICHTVLFLSLCFAKCGFRVGKLTGQRAADFGVWLVGMNGPKMTARGGLPRMTPK